MVEKVTISPAYCPVWWNIAFVPRDIETFWDIFCPTWGRHVLCWGYSFEGECWIVIDPRSNRSFAQVIPRAEFDDYLASAYPVPLTILQIKGSAGSFMSGRIGQTCSSIIGRFLGLRGGTLTPGRLFRTLVKQGADVKEDPYHVYKSQSTRRRP